MSADLDFERCYRAVQSRDARFDGWFFTGVTSTRIYCRPSCPALTPKREHVRFFSTAASAQQAGFRACLRCRPHAAPGSPEWLGRIDVAARAVKLVLDGVVDREGVPGLARRLGYSVRQVHRLLVAEVGTGATALARAQRAQTARLLIETSALPMTEIAFAAGFASLRQFNATVQQVFGRSPSQLRTARRGGDGAAEAAGPTSKVPAPLSLRLAHRRPLAAGELFAFLAARAVPGLEEADGDGYRRSLALPNGHGVVSLRPGEGFLDATFELADLRDLPVAIARCRRLCNLDADPVAVDDLLGTDPALRPLVAARPGLRVPGSVDGFELAVRAVLGQQVSLTRARALGGRIVAAAGSPLAVGGVAGTVTHAFPTAVQLAGLLEADPGGLPLPGARRAALASLAAAVAAGGLQIDAGSSPAELEAQLLAVPGIGPWTAAYVCLRALGDPDAFLPTDLGLRRGAALAGLPVAPAAISAAAERWRPWRAHAQLHLWSLAAAAARGGRRPAPGGDPTRAGMPARQAQEEGAA